MKQRHKVRADNAKIRQLEYEKLTPTQKLAQLDEKLGSGVGAKRQRARLIKQKK